MVNDSLFPGRTKGHRTGRKTAKRKRGVCWACLWVGVAGFSHQAGAEPRGLDQEAARSEAAGVGGEPRPVTEGAQWGGFPESVE